MKDEKKKGGVGRTIARVFGALLALLLLAAAFLTLVPLAQNGDRSPVEGSADWMGRLDDSLTLDRITIPGSHDSATQYVQLAWFSKCQGMGVGEQLEAGCRYLDIRLAAEGDRLKLMHGFVSCRESAFGPTLYLDALLGECYAFLDAHPTETVLFAVKQEHGDESAAQFETLLDAYIQASPEHWLLASSIPALGESRGRLVLLRRYEDEAGLGERAGIPLLWGKQNGYGDPSLNLSAADNGGYVLWAQDRYEYDAEEKWSAFTAGLAADGPAEGDVRLSFLSTKGHATFGHPIAFARPLNAKLAALPAGELDGWIVLDYFSAGLAAHVYESNF
ncbi:MAG: hypothetical protein K6G17_08805 [Oscillospiraceae bacterium]|nr:hypothetical protein [Oscillospiraceae bacterium]